MASQCISRHELEKLLTAEPNDHRLRHLEECPRCRAEFAGFRSFMAGNPHLADSEREAQLAASLQHFILSHETRQETTPSPLKRKARFLSGSLEKSLLALAAVLLVTVSIHLFPAPSGIPAIHLRGGNSPSADLLQPQVAFHEGNARLSWSPLDEAQLYEVEILGSDFRVLEKISVPRNSSLLIKLEKLRLWEEQSPALLWRVTALNLDLVISQSTPRPLVVAEIP